jgi:hypothetical protein
MLDKLIEYAWDPEPPLGPNPLVIPLDLEKQPRMRRTRSVWPRRLDEARSRPGSWMCVVEPMTRSTASQIASEIRHSYHRDLAKLRITGLIEGERWEAEWGRTAVDPNPDHYYVWLRWVSPS